MEPSNQKEEQTLEAQEKEDFQLVKNEEEETKENQLTNNHDSKNLPDSDANQEEKFVEISLDKEKEEKPLNVEIIAVEEKEEESKQNNNIGEVIFSDELKPSLQKLCENCRSVDDYLAVIRKILEDYKYDQVILN